MSNNIEKQEDKFIMMTTQPVERLVCKLAIPTIISMLITAFYNIADTYFVSRIGTSATGAVGIVFSMMAIIQAMGFLFGNGSGNYISRKLGEKKSKEAEEVAATGFYSALIVGIIVCTFSMIFIKPLGKALGATDTILPYTMDYLRFILFGAPFMMASFVLNNQLRFQGNAVYGMVGICVGAIINIILDPILIFVLDFGIAGAAIATSLSQFISMVILFVLCNKKGIVKIKFKNFKNRLYNLKEIIRCGLPSLFRQGIASVAAICLNRFAGVYGDAAIAAMSIVSKVGMFAISALIGFGQGFQPVCGFNYGAKKYDRVNKAFSFCVKLSTIVLTIIAVVGFSFAPQIIGIFKTGDVEVMEIGSAALRWQCFSFPLIGFIIFSNMFLQTIGKAFKASVLSLTRQGLFFLPVLFIIVPLLGLAGLEMVQPIADILSFAVAVPLTYGVIKEMNKNS
ncbi:MAG: MATE family efflux transporter [Lachnotalea sp.]